MTVEPVRYPDFDDVATRLVTAVDELCGQLDVHSSARMLRLKAAVIRDLADQLQLDLGDVPHADRCIIRYDAT